ncbi:hypothetical protein ANN_18526 [Periplaneta americana]|uniref:Uncharacterized protein n=1 Tax=Periplaneta americana TaxID=6978 RepID=A0ABQ8SQ88_PERAM|nr:hypothetical protein ANN_18526 [Periplaneta americana]
MAGTQTSPIPNDIARKALDWNPQGSSGTWKRTVLAEVKSRGKTWGEIKELTKDRVRWRSFLITLFSSLEWWEY